MISVVIPAYNCAKFLRPAIDSILQQDFELPFEVIVVDDGSKDDTPKILAEYASNPRVRIIRKENGGISRAMNMGIEQAKYPWIAVMHADDIALPNRLRRQYEAACAQPDAVVWGTHAYHINELDQVLGMSRFGPRNVEEFNEFWNNGKDVIVLHPTAFLKRDIVLKVGGYDPQFTNSEELDLFSRMAYHGPILAIPEVLLRYRLHGGSNSSKRFFVQRENTRYIRARRKAQQEGLPPLSFAEFRIQRDRMPALVRWRQKIADWSHFHYRISAVSYAQKRRVACAKHLLLAGLMNPKFAIQKLWLQFFSPAARKLMKSAPPSPVHTSNATSGNEVMAP